MPFLQYILIAFACAAMNHLGLVAAAEKVLRHRLPVLNCPKCSAFWLSLATAVPALAAQATDERAGAMMGAVLTAVAMSLLCAWIAVWMELLMGGIDLLYNRLYDTFYPATAEGAADAPDAGRETDTDADGPQRTDDAVPEVR